MFVHTSKSPPTPSPTYTPSPSPTSIPGFELLCAIICVAGYKVLGLTKGIRGRDSSESKDVSYARNSIGINRRGYSGCGGLEKIIEKSETLKSF